MAEIPQITLNNGQQIPQFGFGVFLVPPDETVAAVTSALEAGYRHIDTAQMYGNEAQVGEAIARSGLDRGSLYVTTKLANDAHRPDDARRAVYNSRPQLPSEVARRAFKLRAKWVERAFARPRGYCSAGPARLNDDFANALLTVCYAVQSAGNRNRMSRRQLMCTGMVYRFVGGSKF